MSSPFFLGVDPMKPVKPSFHPLTAPQATPIQHTQDPKIVGTSVLGMKYKDGIILAADNLASFGSLARFKDMQRIFPVGDNTLIAYSGDVSDAQHIQYLLETLMIREAHHQDEHLPSPLTIHNYLTRTMYNRRTKVDPLWNSLLVAGITPPSDAPMVTLPTTLAPADATAPEKGPVSPTATPSEPKDKLEGNLFLGYVDLYGTSFSGPHIATGYAKYIALPLLRAFYGTKGDDINSITKDEAIAVIRKCMEVLYYRDARSLNKFTIGIVSRSGIEILKDQTCETDWSVGAKVRGYGSQVI